MAAGTETVATVIMMPLRYERRRGATDRNIRQIGHDSSLPLRVIVARCHDGGNRATMRHQENKRDDLMREPATTPRVMLGAASEHPGTRLVDHGESYGPQAIERFVRSLGSIETVLDLGAGRGRDLAIVKHAHPSVRAIAIECETGLTGALQDIADEIVILDLEHDPLPVLAGTVNLIIANQILEHTKEIFWIFDQVTRALPVGGSFIFGVPNVASLHNRIALLLLGRQPSQHKLCSAHVRPFSKADTLRFLDECFPGGFELVDFAGAQFYPFPRAVARLLAALAPTMAYSIFFHIKKRRDYRGEFLRYPADAGLQTNFWTGKPAPGATVPVG